MDFKNVDLSNFKIPDIAQGKIIPPGILKQIAKEEKKISQRKFDVSLNAISLILSIIAILVSIITPIIFK